MIPPTYEALPHSISSVIINLRVFVAEGRYSISIIIKRYMVWYKADPYIKLLFSSIIRMLLLKRPQKRKVTKV